MIGIRADANSIIATGHVMRCITIARQFLKLGEDVTFFMADEESKGVYDLYAADLHGCTPVVLGSSWDDKMGEVEALTAAIRERGVRALLVDSYSVTCEYFRELRRVCPVAYIDDLGKEAYPVDLLINYSGYYKELGYEKMYAGVCDNNADNGQGLEHKDNCTDKKDRGRPACAQSVGHEDQEQCDGKRNEGSQPTQFLLGLKYAPLREQFSTDSDADIRKRFPETQERIDAKTSTLSPSEENCAGISGTGRQDINILLTAGGGDMHGMLMAVLEEAARRGLILEVGGMEYKETLNRCLPANSSIGKRDDVTESNIKERQLSADSGITEMRDTAESSTTERQLSADSATTETRDIDEYGTTGRQVSVDYGTEERMLPALVWHVVVGNLVRDAERIEEFAAKHSGVALHRNVSNMASLMRSCEIAVAAAGTMLTECAAVGLPTVFYQVADNQKYNVTYWSSTGGMIFAGEVKSAADAESEVRVLSEVATESEVGAVPVAASDPGINVTPATDTVPAAASDPESSETTETGAVPKAAAAPAAIASGICEEVAALSGDRARREKMSSSLRSIVDGQGARRIAKAILENLRN